MFSYKTEVSIFASGHYYSDVFHIIFLLCLCKNDLVY